MDVPTGSCGSLSRSTPIWLIVRQNPSLSSVPQTAFELHSAHVSSRTAPRSLWSLRSGTSKVEAECAVADCPTAMRHSKTEISIFKSCWLTCTCVHTCIRVHVLASGWAGSCGMQAWRLQVGTCLRGLRHSPRSDPSDHPPMCARLITRQYLQSYSHARHKSAMIGRSYADRSRQRDMETEVLDHNSTAASWDRADEQTWIVRRCAG